MNLSGTYASIGWALQTVAATATASGTLLASEHNPVDATSGNLAFALPTGKAGGTLLSVERIDGISANTCTITGSLRGVGSSALTLLAPSTTPSHEAVMFVADASGSWWPVAGHKTKAWLDARYKQAFIVDAFSTPATAYAALVAAGGGELVFTPGATYTFTSSLLINQPVPTRIIADAVTFIPPSADAAITFNAGRSQHASITMRGGTIDGTTVGGTAGTSIGIKVIDNYGFAAEDLTITHCGTGILYTDSSGWDEGHALDRVYITTCKIGIDFETNGGTGSEGYASWGLVHIDNIPANGIGLKVGAGAGLTVSTIARLVCHTSLANVTAISIAGNISSGTRINAVLESLSAQSNQVGVDIATTANLAGSPIQLTFFGGTNGANWAQQVNNPFNKPTQITVTPGGGPFPAAPRTGNWYYANSAGATATPAAPTISQPRVSLVEIPWQVSIQALLAEFTVAGDAASTFRIGIWSDDGNGNPSALLLDAGTIATGGTPGVSSITLGSALILPAGFYWFGGACQGTTPATMRLVSATDVAKKPLATGTSLPSTAGSLAGYFGATQAGAFGAFTTPGNVSSIPRIGYKTS
jgi:hypothetical protein